jgi:predicted component of type VI protein secretion system
VVVDDPKASRRHARIVVEAGVVEIEDLKSSNGTLLNGNPVTRRVLRDGDTVQIGKTEFVYRDAASPPPAAGTGAAVPAAGGLDDDVDLFAETSQSTPAPPRPAPAPPAAAPEAGTPPPPPAPAAPRPQPPVQPPVQPPPPPAASNVVEFEDEIVEVRRPAAPPTPSQVVGDATETVVRQQRILQFNKKATGGGVLGDDLAQMSSGTRSLVYALVLLFAAGIVYGITWLVR